MSLISKKLIELVEDVEFAEGGILPVERKFSEELKSDDDSCCNDNKLEIVGDPDPGAKVEIYWKKSWGFEDPDYGFIFILPDYDGDVFVDGIICIPNPQGGEKTAESPEWGHIDRYLDNEDIVKIKIYEDTK